MLTSYELLSFKRGRNIWSCQLTKNRKFQFHVTTIDDVNTFIYNCGVHNY